MFVRMQAQQCLADVPEQLRGGAGAAHAVPLVAQAAGDQGQGEACVALFLGCAIRVGDELRAPAGGGEAAIAIQAWRAGLSPLSETAIVVGLILSSRAWLMPDRSRSRLLGQQFVFVKNLRRLLERKQTVARWTQSDVPDAVRNLR